MQIFIVTAHFANPDLDAVALETEAPNRFLAASQVWEAIARDTTEAIEETDVLTVEDYEESFGKWTPGLFERV